MSEKESTKWRGYIRTSSGFSLRDQNCSESSCGWQALPAAPDGLRPSKETRVLKKWPPHEEWHCRSYARSLILAGKTAPMHGFCASNKQEYQIISHIPSGIRFKPGVAESPPQSEFMKWKNVVWVGFSVLEGLVNASRPQLDHCKRGSYMN